MKRIIIIAALLCSAFSASAIELGEQFGVFAGLTTSKVSAKDFDSDGVTQFHLGLLYNKPIFMGFAVQPEISYTMKGASISSTADLLDIASATGSFDTKMGYVELGAQLQWGADLVIARPYVFAEPYLGFATNNKITTSASVSTVLGGGSTDDTVNNVWDNLNRFEYGLAIGTGVEMYEFLQLSLKYYWNFGSLYENQANAKAQSYTAMAKSAFQNAYKGLCFSIAYMF